MTPEQLQILSHCALGGIATVPADDEDGLSLLDMGMAREVGPAEGEHGEDLVLIAITLRGLVAVDVARPALEISDHETSRQRLWLAEEIVKRVDEHPDPEVRSRLAENLRRRAATLQVLGR